MEPVVVTDRAERTVAIRVACDELVVTESRYGVAEVGPAPHVHRLHSDCFYVLDGTFTLVLADGDHALGPGSFVLVPPNVVHAFRNASEDEVRFLNLHAPGMGFDRYVQQIAGLGEVFLPELAARFDQHAPPDDGGLDPVTAILAGPGVGERLGGTLIKADRPELSVLEVVLKPGDEIADHVHRGQHDVFFVLDGTLRFRLDGDEVHATSGACVAAAPGVVHGVQAAGDAPARLLNVHAPGGFAEYLRALAALRATGTEPDVGFFEHHDVFDPD